MGSFGVDQVKEIACGLEQSGHRFLWSLSQPQPKGKITLILKLSYPKGFWIGRAEQQLNAFETVVELGFGVEIKMDYRREFFYDGNENIVSAGELERGIRCLMELGEEKVESLKEMSEK
ncbi:GLYCOSYLTRANSFERASE [Salix purpurea]|uniref:GLYCOSYLTRANSFERASE n=1 Tax=Salix purpurea TaxID=77065 RepID=A0A9Q0VXR3_SALPP|nr:GLYCOSYLTRANSFERASE [Salix purpurea]